MATGALWLLCHFGQRQTQTRLHTPRSLAESPFEHLQSYPPASCFSRPLRHMVHAMWILLWGILLQSAALLEENRRPAKPISIKHSICTSADVPDTPRSKAIQSVQDNRQQPSGTGFLAPTPHWPALAKACKWLIYDTPTPYTPFLFLALTSVGSPQ